MLFQYSQNAVNTAKLNFQIIFWGGGKKLLYGILDTHILEFKFYRYAATIFPLQILPYIAAIDLTKSKSIRQQYIMLFSYKK